MHPGEAVSYPKSCIKALYLFGLNFGLGDTPGSVQGLLRALLSNITLSSLGVLVGIRDQTQVSNESTLPYLMYYLSIFWSIIFLYMALKGGMGGSKMEERRAHAHERGRIISNKMFLKINAFGALFSDIYYC